MAYRYVLFVIRSISFNFITGIINFGLVVFVLLWFKSHINNILASANGSYSVSGDGVNASLNVQTSVCFGLYSMMIASVLFTILSFDKKLLLFNENLIKDNSNSTISSPVIQTGIKYCPNCGKPSPAQSAFCGSCGKSF